MDITTILSEALSGDSNVRNTAEQKIDIICNQNFGQFLYDCASILSNEGVRKGIRQIAATLIKNMISRTEKYKGLWEQLSGEVRKQIKECVLSTLASKDNDVRKAAAFTVAGN
jgi:hypothetical protein